MYGNGGEAVKVIKGVLEEELGNSLRQEKAYKKALDVIPRGVLVKKSIKGNEYYYIVLRKEGKVKFVYKGRLSKKEIAKYEDQKKMRAKYRRLLSEIRKQISFLRKALRAKEIRSV